MDKSVKIGIGVAAAAAIGFLIFKGAKTALSLKETAENIQVSLLGLPKIHKVELATTKIKIDLRVDNPVDQLVKLKIPSIRLYYKGKLLVTAPVNNTVYEIKPMATGQITNLPLFEVSNITLLGSAANILTTAITAFSSGAGLVNNATAMANKIMAQSSQIINDLGFDIIAEANGMRVRVKYNM